MFQSDPPRRRRNPHAMTWPEGSMEAHMAEVYDRLHPNDPDGPWLPEPRAPKLYAESTNESTNAIGGSAAGPGAGAANEIMGPPTRAQALDDAMWRDIEAQGLGRRTGDPDKDGQLTWEYIYNYPWSYARLYDQFHPPADEEEQRWRDYYRYATEARRHPLPPPPPPPPGGRGGRQEEDSDHLPGDIPHARHPLLPPPPLVPAIPFPVHGRDRLQEARPPLQIVPPVQNFKVPR